MALGFLAALGAVLQYAVRAHVPGSLEPGGLTLANFAALGAPLYRRVFLETAGLCAATAVLAVLAAFPLAWTLVRTRSRAWRATVLIVAVTPLFLGDVVRTYGWLVVLGQGGVVNAARRALGLAPAALLFTHGAVLAALVHVTIPVCVIMLAAGLAHVERDLERAAAALGAGPVRAFLTVTLPLALPGVLAALGTAFAWTFSAFATPQLIGGGRVTMVANLVYSLGLASFDFPFAAALATAGLALTALTLGLLRAATARLAPPA